MIHESIPLGCRMLEDKMLEVISEREMYERFDEMLDDVYENVSICGYDYDPSIALKAVDPIAYQEAFNNFVSSQDYDEHFDEDGDFDGWSEGE